MQLPKDHIHTYKRKKGKARGGLTIFMCEHPDCTHTHDKDLIEGKRALCPFCQSEFILSKDMLRRARPHCGCRALSPENRLKVASMGHSVEEQQRIADKIARDILKGKMYS